MVLINVRSLVNMPFILSYLFLIKFEFVTETWFNAGEITWPVFKDKFKCRFLPKKKLCMGYWFNQSL